jgi:EpsI family protein
MAKIARPVKPNYLILIIFLLGAQWGVFSIQRSAKSAASAPKPDIAAIPITLGDWRGEDRELDRISLETLRPDVYLVRQYETDEGRGLNVTIIYGHKKSNFHSPALCFLGSGWNIVEKKKISTRVGGDDSGGRNLEMTRLLLQKGGDKAVVLYSFLSPGGNTASWNVLQARLLGASLLGRQPRAALLRLILPVQGDEKATDRAAEDFLRELDPYVRQILSL